MRTESREEVTRCKSPILTSFCTAMELETVELMIL